MNHSKFQLNKKTQNRKKKLLQKERLHSLSEQLLFLGGIGIKTEIKTKAAKLRRQRDSYEKEKMRIDQSERNLTFKREKEYVEKTYEGQILNTV